MKDNSKQYGGRVFSGVPNGSNYIYMFCREP